MLTFAAIILSLAMAQGQDHTRPPHPTGPPHPDRTTAAPITNHKFNADNAAWLKDPQQHVLVLKTDSGCYINHLERGMEHEASTEDGLKHIQDRILREVQHAHEFRSIPHHEMEHLSSEIKTACPTILRYEHHPH